MTDGRTGCQKIRGWHQRSDQPAPVALDRLLERKLPRRPHEHCIPGLRRSCRHLWQTHVEGTHFSTRVNGANGVMVTAIPNIENKLTQNLTTHSNSLIKKMDTMVQAISAELAAMQCWGSCHSQYFLVIDSTRPHFRRSLATQANIHSLYNWPFSRPDMQNKQEPTERGWKSESYLASRSQLQIRRHLDCTRSWGAWISKWRFRCVRSSTLTTKVLFRIKRVNF